MDWASLGGWWLDELADDPAYNEEVLPLALDLLDPQPGHTYLDLGCGEGRAMAAIGAAGATPVGVDVAGELLVRASGHGPVVRTQFPPLPFDDASFDGVIVVLVLEHLADDVAVFEEAARVTCPGGVLGLVVNHPVWTAPGSTPISDDDDDEVLWRPGEYFSSGWSDEPAGEGTIRFHHRTMSALLTNAAQAGWSLARLVECGASATQAERIPLLGLQRHIPRVLGARWLLDQER